ncbi:DeoR/GlpR family DNA-binding transcription regulator [Tetragenococcus koreensis]|uniref:DeoR/GlpR family DNA-binding transcription regulator n=1 Tax=Tetragenococcus koreensis TaxID=290335 RepID=UPI000F4EC344|nr:DeoR/GlpR family DNA-binding transcription regulator [Tetragenococcus koreensis]MDN6840634.1 DeoR/GlpR family DNA-binding transcription regulator [Tetragenococcus halophilus]AYW45040.1 DeoR/GlpR transcriptional regulator [Tetragenococcus koreensis]MCF1585013.1 DeoR/GlpR family DNA-binding transcription regulator [Tetragenococcus koreensis]MCF1614526.1 DeoR/GlpR family DNA-binding transcription regulator [Tetragenococcus koreensis]MCF1624359.1 DeoR/GlpR family DNA-binding transcription regul
MIQKERLSLILEELEKEETLSLKGIIELTGSSRDTARRDIVKLAETNAVDRTYGGISLPHSFNRLDEYLDRAQDLDKEKDQLAKVAALFVKDTKLIFLDVSTTISFIPRHLANNSELFAVTNSLDISDQLIRNSDCKTRILGGNIDRKKRSVVGTKPLMELEDYHFDFAFLSAAGINTNGIYYAYEEDIDYKAKIRAQSDQVVLLIDETKLNLAHNFRVFDFAEVDTLVTNQLLSDELKEIIERKQVQIIYS